MGNKTNHASGRVGKERDKKKSCNVHLWFCLFVLTKGKTSVDFYIMLETQDVNDRIKNKFC